MRRSAHLNSAIVIFTTTIPSHFRAIDSRIDLVSNIFGIGIVGELDASK